MKQELDDVLAGGVETGAVPGVSAVVVNADGVLYEGAAGERAIGTGAPMEVDTVGAIFSMTKALTGTAAMQLVEAGRVDLDAPAADVLPVLGDIKVLDGFDGDEAQLRPPTSDITLRNLLTHTSGFVYDIWNADITRWVSEIGHPSLFSLEKRALELPLAFDPGTRWHYGIGIDWVGLIVEEVSGQTLGEYFAEHLTGPLGMTDTAFVHNESMLERASAVHARLPDRSFAAIELPAAEAPEFEMGGGGLFGTMLDYARFLRMILNDGELDGTRVLAADTVQTMTANHIGDLRVEPLPSSDHALSLDAEFFPGEPKSWGLTFQISETACDTGRSAGTLMWAGLANSFFWIDREADLAGCYLSQILPFADTGTLDLYYAFEKAVYDSA